MRLQLLPLEYLVFFKIWKQGNYFDMTNSSVETGQITGQIKGEILVVDDSRENLQLLSRILTAEGYKVRLAVTGKLALASIKARQPDLVLLDVCMPDMSGYDVCKQLRQDKKTQHIPVLFITVMGGLEDKVKGFEAGARDYIVKPFQQEEVLARVNTHVALSQMHNKLEQLIWERTQELRRINEQLEQEIAWRKQVEAERHLLFEAINQSDESVVITDENGNIVFVNPAFERLTGYSKQEVLGQNPRILQSGKHDKNFYKELWKTILNGKTWHGELINKRKDGTLFIEKASISPVFDDTGKIVNFIAVKHDVTQQRSLEEQLRQAQKMESVGRLAGGVAHDYNNMLQVILCSVQLLLARDDLKKEIIHHLKQIEKAANRAADVTKQLLAFSRKQAISPRPVNINELLSKEILTMLGRLLAEDIDLRFYPNADPAIIRIDPGQIHQAVTNLAINARDAMPQGGKLTIETKNVLFDEEYCKNHIGAKPGRYVMVAVSDNGIGIDKEIMPYIFEPFFTTKEEYRGTGLGLPSVYGIVKQSGGYITVYSEPGVGTTFKLYFPAYEDNQEIDFIDTIRKDLSDEEVSLRILLVEDEEMVRELTKNLLEGLGHTVLEAKNPKDAIKKVAHETEKIDLLLTDLVMPGMSGPQLSEKIKEIMPDIKVLYMSGYTSNVIARHGILDKGVNFIQKPFCIKHLSEKIRQTMGQKE